MLKKYRLCTTISQKHLEILKKHTEKAGTQKKVIELALESLDNGSKPNLELSREEKLSIRLLRTESACLIQRDGFKLMMETANTKKFEKYVEHYKPLEYALEYYIQKPLKECSLEEIINGLIINARTSNWFDSINCTDDNSHYTLKMTHIMGINVSEQTKISIESVIKSYGLRAESIISPKTIFIKIFKN